MGFREEVGAAKTELAAIRKRNEEIRARNKAIAERNQQREVALKLFRRGQSAAGETPLVLATIRKLQQGLAIRREAREREISERFAGAGLEPIFRAGKLVGFSDVERFLSFPVEFIGELAPERLAVLEAEGLVTLETELPQLTFEAAAKPTDILGGAEFELRKFRFTGTQLTKFVAGAGLALTGFLRFGKELITEPIPTITRAGVGAVVVGERIISGEGFPEIGALIKREPEFVTGFVLGEVAIFKGFEILPKAALKISDIARTRRLKELKATDIIDPKFFLGETFPAIRRGETAGELLREFRPLLPGERLPAGFTAVAKPFAKETIALRGTSELPGVFQAPLVSPRFLRVGGEAERKLFTLKIFDTPRPSIIRITPRRIRLVPGVRETQRQLSANIRETRRFLERAPKGESFIPFIKTEKEAIIPAGTKLELIDKRFFIKFEGRRVPIFEFKVVGGKIEQQLKGVGKLPTIEDISKSLSRIRGERGLVTPLSSVPVGGLSSSIRSLARSSRALASRSSSLISKAIRSAPISIRGRPRPVSKLSSVGGIPSRASGVSGISRIFGGSGVSRAVGRANVGGGITGVRGREREREVKPKKPKKRKKRITPIAPSFTAIVARLTGGLPEEFRGLGILPTKLRRLTKRRGKKLTNL